MENRGRERPRVHGSKRIFPILQVLASTVRSSSAFCSKPIAGYRWPSTTDHRHRSRSTHALPSSVRLCVDGGKVDRYLILCLPQRPASASFRTASDMSEVAPAPSTHRHIPILPVCRAPERLALANTPPGVHASEASDGHYYEDVFCATHWS